MKICLIRISRGIRQEIDKFRKIIEKKEQLGKTCDILHIVKLDDSRESVFLIQDMFPITEEYIEREYTIAGNHLMLTSEHTVKVIEQKARSVGNVKAWCEVHAYTTGCAINIGEIKAGKIVFTGSILALIIWYEKNTR